MYLNYIARIVSTVLRQLLPSRSINSWPRTRMFTWSFGRDAQARSPTPLVWKRVRNGVSPGLHPSISGLCGARESWRQSLPPTASSLANPPTGPPDIRNSVYSALRLVERQARQELLCRPLREGEPTSLLSSRRLPAFSDINESFWSAAMNARENVCVFLIN